MVLVVCHQVVKGQRHLLRQHTSHAHWHVLRSWCTLACCTLSSRGLPETSMPSSSRDSAREVCASHMKRPRAAALEHLPLIFIRPRNVQVEAFGAQGLMIRQPVLRGHDCLLQPNLAQAVKWGDTTTKHNAYSSLRGVLTEYWGTSLKTGAQHMPLLTHSMHLSSVFQGKGDTEPRHLKEIVPSPGLLARWCFKALDWPCDPNLPFLLQQDDGGELCCF